MNKKREGVIFKLMILVLLILVTLLSINGAVKIPYSEFGKVLMNSNQVPDIWPQVFWQLRFPKIITAILGGASLGVCGLLMQTYFRNPLAGPFVLGVHSGSTLGVALWVMGIGYLPFLINDFTTSLGMVFFAIVGGALSLIALLILSKHIPGKSILLVMGLVFGHFSSGIINVLISISDATKIRTFLLWTLGSFQRVSGDKLIIFSSFIIVGLFLSLFLKKSLNVMILGEQYSKSMGLSVHKTKYYLITLTAVLSGVVTAFCGPIVFIGIITPHLFKKIVKRSDHKLLLPGVMILGAILALSAELISGSFEGITIPLNAVLGLLGVPVIISFLWKNRKGEL